MAGRTTGGGVAIGVVVEVVDVLVGGGSVVTASRVAVAVVEDEDVFVRRTLVVDVEKTGVGEGSSVLEGAGGSAVVGDGEGSSVVVSPVVSISSSIVEGSTVGGAVRGGARSKL